MLAGKDTLRSPQAVEEIRRLEELWEATAAGEAQLPRRRRWPSGLGGWLLARPGWILVVGWPAFVGSLLAAAPASEPNYAPPVWVDLVVSGLWLALIVAALAALGRSALVGYSASLAAAGACLGLSVACTVTDHHTGGWWAYELSGSMALAALSVLGLRRARGSRSSGRSSG